MTEKTSNWFEVSVSCKQMQEDGTTKKVTEVVVVDAMTFAEAEKRAMKELSSKVKGVEIKNINPAAYKSVFFDDKDGEKWFKAKLSFITLDEATGKEKRSNTTYLVQADTFNGALANIEETMDGSNDYVTANICETKIVDVYCR